MANKVQRRGRSKVHRKLKSNKLIKNKGFGNLDPKLRDQWDKKQSLLQNYERLGITASINSSSLLPFEVKTSNEAAMVLDTEFKVPESITRNDLREKNFIDEQEREYLEKLIERFGRDYKAMERDVLKLNYLQKSGQHLETRIKRLRAYKQALDEEEAERVQEVVLKEKEDKRKKLAAEALVASNLKLKARRIVKGKV